MPLAPIDASVPLPASKPVAVTLPIASASTSWYSKSPPALPASVVAATLFCAAASSTSPSARASRLCAVIAPAADWVIEPPVDKASVPLPTSSAACTWMPPLPPSFCKVRSPVRAIAPITWIAPACRLLPTTSRGAEIRANSPPSSANPLPTMPSRIASPVKSVAAPSASTPPGRRLTAVPLDTVPARRIASLAPALPARNTTRPPPAVMLEPPSSSMPAPSPSLLPATSIRPPPLAMLLPRRATPPVKSVPRPCKATAPPPVSTVVPSSTTPASSLPASAAVLAPRTTRSPPPVRMLLPINEMPLL